MAHPVADKAMSELKGTHAEKMPVVIGRIR